MASGPITSWQKEGWKMKAMTDFLFLGSKITSDGDWSHEIKRHLLPGRKAMTNLLIILKRKYITFPTKVRLVKAMVFPVVMYGWESWIIKKAEHQRIHAFEPWAWRRLLRVLWIARRSKTVNPKGNQPWIFTGRTDTEAEVPVLQPLDVKSWLTGKDPDAGKDWRQKEKRVTEDEIVGLNHQFNGHEFEQTLGDSEGSLACCSFGIAKSPTRLSKWTTTTAATVYFTEQHF